MYWLSNLKMRGAVNLTLSPTGGIGKCSKTHLYINMKLLDFSYIWKTKILKKKKIRFFYPSPPSSGIGDCSKTHLYIDMKVLDFSWISKTKILKKKKIRFFYPIPPQRGVLKKWRFWKWVGEPTLQNMICSAIKIRPAYKISVLYLQNQASYSHFSLVNVMRNLNFTKYWNPEISLKFWDFGDFACDS